MPRKNGTKSPRQHCEGKAVGYVRRSTDRQEQSIPDQKRAIEQYCQQHKIRLLRFYVDDAISGTKASNRPAFQEMVAFTQNGRCDFEAVVVRDAHPPHMIARAGSMGGQARRKVDRAGFRVGACRRSRLARTWRDVTADPAPEPRP